MITPVERRADAVLVGDHVYDNRAPNWLRRWPVVTRVETIAAGRIAITAGRLFVHRPDEMVLIKRAGLKPYTAEEWRAVVQLKSDALDAGED